MCSSVVVEGFVGDPGEVHAACAVQGVLWAVIKFFTHYTAKPFRWTYDGRPLKTSRPLKDLRGPALAAPPVSG